MLHKLGQVQNCLENLQRNSLLIGVVYYAHQLGDDCFLLSVVQDAPSAGEPYVVKLHRQNGVNFSDRMTGVQNRIRRIFEQLDRSSPDPLVPILVEDLLGSVELFYQGRRLCFPKSELRGHQNRVPFLQSRGVCFLELLRTFVVDRVLNVSRTNECFDEAFIGCVRNSEFDDDLVDERQITDEVVLVLSQERNKAVHDQVEIGLRNFVLVTI